MQMCLTTIADVPSPAIATGMDWRELEALIREERRAGNPVAGAIHSLQLDQNKITLLLSNLLDGEEVRRGGCSRNMANALLFLLQICSVLLDVCSVGPAALCAVSALCLLCRTGSGVTVC
jgi:hypothetical protein